MPNTLPLDIAEQLVETVARDGQFPNGIAALAVVILHQAKELEHLRTRVMELEAYRAAA